MIKSNQLKYFVACVEAGSLTLAAKKLYISQPALSKQLFQLEQELECQLFHRKTTGIELTEAGKHFYSRASAIVNDMEQLSFDMRVYSNRNTLKVGALPSIGSHLIPALIPKINTSHKIELIIKDATSELVDMLEHDRIDIAFVQDATKYNNILVEHLFYESYDAILPENSPLSEKENLKLSDLLKESIILHKHPCDIRTFFENFCKINNLKYTILMELEFNDSILPFVKNSVGPTILPHMVSSQIEHSGIIVRDLSDTHFGRTIDFLYKPGIKKLAREIINFTREIQFG